MSGSQQANRSALLFALLAALVLLATRSAANEGAGGAAERALPQPSRHDMIDIVLHEDGVSLDVFIDKFSQWMDHVLVIGPNARSAIAGGKAKTIEITNAISIPRSDVFETFKAILQAHNLAVFEIARPGANIYLVDDLTSSMSKGGAQSRAPVVPVQEILDDPEWRLRNTIVTTVITLAHMDVAQAKTEVSQLIKGRGAGTIIPVPAAQSIIISEFAPTVYHIAQMLSLMDKAESKLELVYDEIAVLHAQVSEIEPVLIQLLEDPGQQRLLGTQRTRTSTAAAAGRRHPAPKIVPNPRMNSLMVYCVRDDVRKIKELVARLDRPVQAVVPAIRQYELEHAVADDVAATLNELISETEALATGREAGGRTQQPAFGGSVEDDPIVIVPEPYTNSLLIRASVAQYAWLETVIQGIDQRLPQVLVEVAIVELAEDFASTFGVELGLLETPDSGSSTGGFGFTGFGLSNIIQSGDGVRRVPTATGGLVGGILRLDDFQTPLIINAIGSDNRSNLLSAPYIVTNDNTQAVIEAIESQVTTTSTLTATGNSQASSEFAEAPLRLAITPHISSDDSLRLEIELQVNSFTGSQVVTSNGVFPAPKTSRNLSASVTVPDQATVVLGGVSQTINTEDQTKVPVLGDLPLLGSLFRTTTQTESKTTLYLFVTPHILDDHDFSDLIGQTQKRELEMAALTGDQTQCIDAYFAKKRQRGERDETTAQYAAPFDVPRYRSPMRPVRER